MAIYTLAVHWDTLRVTLPNLDMFPEPLQPSGYGTQPDGLSSMWLGLGVAFIDPVGFFRGAVVEFGIRNRGDHWQSFQQDWAIGAQALFGPGRVVVPPANALNLGTRLEDPANFGAAWFGAETMDRSLSIAADDGSGFVTLTSPLGATPYTFGQVGFGAGELNLLANRSQTVVGIGGGILAGDVGQGMAFSVAFHDLLLAKDGMAILGAELGTQQPGNFSDNGSLQVPNTPWGIEGGGIFSPPLPALINGRTRDRLLGGMDYPAQSSLFPTSNTFSGYLVGLQLVAGLSLDLTNEPHTGRFWGVWTPTAARNVLAARYSESHGHTWVERVAVTTPADVLQSASIQVLAGTVFVLYYDQTLTQVYQISSSDNGLNWSTPLAVQISGTNPRLVIDPASETFHYFYANAMNIYVQRSFNGGATLFDTQGIVVATNVPAQDFGATLGPDRSLVVAYVDSTQNWQSRVSFDSGANWQDS